MNRHTNPTERKPFSETYKLKQENRDCFRGPVGNKNDEKV